MPKFSIDLNERQTERLRRLAAKAGLTDDNLLNESVKYWLDSTEPSFTEAAEYVLRKNAALYDRLAE